MHLLSDYVVGVADNGDGWRVSGPAGIRPTAPAADDLNARAVHREHRLVASRFWAHPSSPAAVAYASRGLSRAPGGERYDLRQIAATYLTLLALAFAGALARRVESRAVAAVALVFASPGCRHR